MAEPLLAVAAQIHAKPGQEDALREALLALIPTTRQEEGCVQYDLHESAEQQGRFLFFENWTSREALDRHLAAPHLEAFKARFDELVAHFEVLTFHRIG
jgi:quinol monooxygenase YgiN